MPSTSSDSAVLRAFQKLGNTLAIRNRLPTRGSSSDGNLSALVTVRIPEMNVYFLFCQITTAVGLSARTVSS